MTPAIEHGVKNLIVARESDANDQLLLQGMIQQTLALYKDEISAFDRLYELGSAPVDNPELVNGRRIPEDDDGPSANMRAVQFRIGDTMCLYSKGSAAKRNEAGENEFVKALSNIVTTAKPQHVRVATISRLIRSSYFSGEMYNVFMDNRVTVWHGNQEIRTWETHGTARLQWDIMSYFASMERNAIITRMLLGEVAKFRRGEWLWGRRSIPPGYRLENKRLVVVPGMRDHVNKIIRLLGTPGLQRPEMVRALGEIGLASPRDETGWGFDATWRHDGTPYVPHDRTGGTDPDEPGRNAPESDESADDDEDEDPPFGTVASIKDVNGFHNRLTKFLDLWQYGTYETRRTNPLSGLTVPGIETEEATVGGQTVERLKFKYDYDELKHPDGWATDDEFVAARALVDLTLAGRSRSRNAGGQARFPLIGPISTFAIGQKARTLVRSGNQGRRGNETYQLLEQNIPASSTAVESDELTVRRGAQLGKLRWRDSKKRLQPGVTPVGTVYAADLHNALATSAIEGLRNGIPVRRHQGTYSPAQEAHEHRLETVRQQLEDAKRAELQALREHRENRSNPHTAEAYELALSEATSYRQRLERGLNRLQAPREQPLAQRLTLESDHVVGVLAALGTCVTSIPAELAGALDETIRNLTLQPDGHTLSFSFDLQLPTTDGAVLAGPFEGAVPQRQSRSADARTSSHASSAGDEQVARLLMTSNEPVSALLRSRDRTSGRALVEGAVRYLEARGLEDAGARSILAAAPLATRQVLWDHLHGQDLPAVHAAFASHAIDTFKCMRGFKRGGDTWLTINEAQLAILDHLKRLPEKCEPVGEFLTWLHANGRPYSNYLNYVRKVPGQEPSPNHVVTLDPLHPNGARAGSQITLLRCTCGGFLDRYARVPENKFGVLCSDPNCLRGRGDTSITYPLEYLTFTFGEAHQRLNLVAPEQRRLRSGQLVPSTLLMSRIADNKLRRGIHGAVTSVDIADYLRAIADRDISDDGAIREWMIFNGLQVSTRGAISRQAREDFAIAHYARDTSEVRAWALDNGRDWVQNGPRHQQLLRDYARVREARQSATRRGGDQ